MHPHIYDRLMVDGKIQMNAYLKYYQDKVDEAKQMILNDYFQEQKKKGFSYIFNDFIFWSFRSIWVSCNITCN